MKIYDQHIHSAYSFDGHNTIEEFIKVALDFGLDHFITTDHIDLDHIASGKDIDFDITAQHKEIAKLQSKYQNITLLRGIEIGYVKSELPRINKILEENSFDLVNFSIHELGEIDFYEKDFFVKKGIRKVLSSYFDLVIEALDSNVDFDVLCHFDFGFKSAYLCDDSLFIKEYEDKIITIFNKIIELDKALEINIKVQSFINDEHTKYILNLYKKLGGKNITLSTDAHRLKDFYKGFDHYLELIKNAGFDHVNYFVNRKRYNFDITNN